MDPVFETLPERYTEAMPKPEPVAKSEPVMLTMRTHDGSEVGRSGALEKRNS
ncbi:hypothetical protein [Streptomyces sp. NPDC050535]|uniref:hypothetical protein n=1 Tax=Streptomyces sp. NPDC050535 TaxID=3365626 RepID=UPI0037AB0ACE